MISLSLYAERHVPRDRVRYRFTIRNQRAAQLDEARACLANPLLAVWVPELTSLVTSLTEALASDDAHVARLEATIPPLESAVAAEAAAVSALELAQVARADGSLDRKTALKLRDDLEAADSALLVRRRELAESARAVNACIPSNDVPPEIPGREVAEGYARFVTNVRFQPGRSASTFDPVVEKRWLEFTEAEVAGVPVHMLRLIKKAESEKKQRADYRHENITLPVPEYLERMTKYRTARIAHIRAKGLAAQKAFEEAQAKVAALGGGAK